MTRRDLVKARPWRWNGTIVVGLLAGVLTGVVGSVAGASSAAAFSCPCTIFAPSATPGTANWPDDQSVEVGVKFKSDVPGLISAVRFYKGDQNVGTHVGSLWAVDGTLLAQATFSAETASGWEQVAFSPPVLIAANTTYIASYLAPNGRYSADNYGLTNGIDSPPLHAIADVVAGGNGVFVYGPGGQFPTQTFKASNYWVDVVFAPSSPFSAHGASPVMATEGVTGTATVATINDPDPTATPANYTASIDWGDGTAAGSGVVTGPTGGPFAVSGTHTFPEAGNFAITVHIAEQTGGTNAATVTTPAPVRDAALAASGVTITTADPVNATVATFTDADPGGIVGDYTATINWGDGTAAGPGTVGAAGSGFAVSGVHTYSGPGPFTVQTTVCDGPGNCATASTTITLTLMTGRAYGLSGSVSLDHKTLLSLTPTPDTGSVATPAASSTAPPCVAVVKVLFVNANTACASVVTANGPDSSTANASVVDATIAVTAIPVVTIGAVQTQSTTTCAGSIGTTTISYLKVGSTVVIAKPTMVAPNTAVKVLGVSLRLNEQTPVPGGLMVNGVHVTTNTAGLAQTDIVVSSAKSDIHDCAAG